MTHELSHKLAYNFFFFLYRDEQQSEKDDYLFNLKALISFTFDLAIWWRSKIILCNVFPFPFY